MTAGSCPSCGAPIAVDRGACLICALPVGAPTAEPLPVVVKRAAGLPIPPQTATLIAIFALGFGGVVGSTLSGGLGQLLAAANEAPPAALVSDAPDDDTTSTPGGSGSSTGGDTTPTEPPTAEVPPADPYVPPLPTDPPLDPPLDPPPDPPRNGPERVAGAVVHVNPEAESYSVADGSGNLKTVHVSVDDLPDAGIEVKVPADPLFNTTYEEAGRRKELDAAGTATFSGTVTFIDEKSGRYVLSAAGSSVVVTAPADEQGRFDLPDLAASITVQVDVTPVADDVVARKEAPAAQPSLAPVGGECRPTTSYPQEPVESTVELEQTSYTVDFEALSYTSLAGIVQAVCEKEDRIVISADDVRALGADLVLSASDEIDPSVFEEGESVTAAVDPAPGDDGANDLWGIAGDDGVEGADDAELGQGDLAK